ncbi:MAG TPA: hypothetical protein VFQ87_08050 [Bradyrhizobium sp.]|nr:hypothetical protein [Bradyrhizobium sp.]
MIDKSMLTNARRRRAAMLPAVAICCSLFASAAPAQSLVDRFKSIFGGNSDAAGSPSSPATVQDGGGLTCPDVKIRPGASTYAVAAPGKQPVGNDLRYQATIARYARDCNLENGRITARVGIQGRVIVGPAGAPASVEIPLRVAVVKDGVNEKVITTTVVRTTVAMGEGLSVPFSVVAEDVVYPAVSVDENDSYVFYIGFDPQALKPEPKPKVVRKKAGH